jgi:hypothetical protein
VHARPPVRLNALLLAPVLAACGATPGPTPSGPPRVTLDPDVASAIVAQGGLLSAPGDEAGRAGQGAPYLKAELLADGEKVKLDGQLAEWPARTRAETAIQGSGDGLNFAAAIRYDATALYVGGEVTTATLHRTARFADDEDHASLVLSFGAGTAAAATYEVNLFAGKPGESTGQVRLAGARGTIRGAQIVEAPSAGGYTFEASIPWSAFAEAHTIRVGLRGAVRYYERGERGQRIVATGPGDVRHPGELPQLPTDPEQSLDEGFLKDHGLRGQAPTSDLLADVAGDGMKERVQVWGSTLTVCGPGYRGGKDYFFRDLGGQVVRVEARPVARRSKDDLVVVRRVVDGDVKRDWFEVLSFLDRDDPERTFGQEIAVVEGERRLETAVHAVAGQIEVSTLPARGWDGASYRVPAASDVFAVLLPWGQVRSRTYRFDGARFAMVREVGQPGVAPEAAAAPRIRTDDAAPRPNETPAALPASSAGVPASVPAASPGALLEQYKRDHRLAASTSPRTELSADLDGDGRPEHIALVGRDLVVSGPSIGRGRSYSSLTLEQFAAPTDIHDVTARDLAGQGAAHVVVRGTRHVTPAGGAVVDEDALFIYALRGDALARVFGIETARAQGGKRVQGLVQFVPSRTGRGFDVDVRPGRAVGWGRTTYPWPEETPGSGAVEPLLLPWGSVKSARYAWDGSRYAP